MNKLFFYLAMLLTSMWLSGSVSAHEAGITDTHFDIKKTSVWLTYTVPQDLIEAITADAASEGRAGEIEAILKGFSLRNEENDCPGVLAGRRILEEIKSAQYVFNFDCKAPLTSLHMTYDLFFDEDPKHTNIARISLLGISGEQAFTNDRREHTVDVKSVVMHLAAARKGAKSGQSEPPAMSLQKPAGTHFFPIGLEHILLGFDHVLFLICLVLLPMSPLVILTLVTSFTLAHSITLSLSVLDVVALPPSIVEAVIALSIVVVSIRTIVILRTPGSLSVSSGQIKERLITSFVFGLIHGFGFSYVLKEIGLGDQAFFSLLFFNLGVEAGQLLILVVLLPVIWLLGKQFPSWYWARATSVVTGLIGLFWLIERTVLA